MDIIIKTGIVILNIIYAFIKLLPVRSKIVYISRQSDEVPIDFVMIKQYMEEYYPEYENVFLVKTLKKGVLNKIIYMVYMIKMMYHIGTAKAVVLDTYCIPVSVLKQRRGLVVIQIWHALGAFKKFGYSILDKEEGSSSKLAKSMKMHENYTYVLTSSEFCRPYFAEAFHQEIDKVKAIPLPRVDILMSESWKKECIEKIRGKYPRISEKKVIVYAPTFRKGTNQLEQAVDKLLSMVDDSKYEVIVKQHPLSDLKITSDKAIVDDHFTTQEILNIADYVITDYSATMYEAVILEKPLFFYVFDFEEYVKNRDFYLDLKTDLPGYMSSDAKDILRAIETDHYSFDDMKQFEKKMIETNSKTCTQRVCELIVDEIENRRK